MYTYIGDIHAYAHRIHFCLHTHNTYIGDIYLKVNKINICTLTHNTYIRDIFPYVSKIHISIYIQCIHKRYISIHT